MFRFIVGLDQAMNPLVYGGSEDVTLSAQTAYHELLYGKNKFTRKFIDWIFRTFFGEHQHCYNSLLLELDEFPKEAHVLSSLLRDKGLVIEG